MLWCQSNRQEMYLQQILMLVGSILVPFHTYPSQAGYFGTNLGQMMRKAPRLTPPPQTSAPHQPENFWPPAYDSTCNTPNTRRIVSGFEPRTLQPQSRDLTTRPPRPLE
ncbi:hypothetical protein AVEN_150639-1 [Araneus ventricosus]|uniref:Uncharacterized protein n=1 Tax=Araneus ventricosus TaxID=182803 RepID=A0A4Y2TY35_ARAVE|nr:hypothetical protein AVEN_150639-1 [Araneus ventricosus]